MFRTLAGFLKGAAAVRGVLADTGARDEVERMIQTRYATAEAALRDAPFAPAGAAALARLASRALVRDS